jgi:hypothetical protein
VDWKLDCLFALVLWTGGQLKTTAVVKKKATAQADPPPAAKDDNRKTTANAKAGFSASCGAGRPVEWVAL